MPKFVTCSAISDAKIKSKWSIIGKYSTLQLILVILELSLFAGVAYPSRKYIKSFQNIEVISYYWLAFTILTGIWEVCFISNYHSINDVSQKLITNGEHAWTNKYTLNYVFPWNVAKIFYAEYGAWADREYMTPYDGWSRTIEGSHALFCGLFALLSIYGRITKKKRYALIMAAVGMGCQLMNSVLYMVNYFIQSKDEYSCNYNNNTFPMGFALIERPFMYVNIFWTLMPIWVILTSIYYDNKKIKNH